jgi:phospholipid-binding lipoprotein MlaA
MRRSLAWLAAALLLGGCATLPPGPRDARDPMERTNRAVFKFNRAADKAVLRPAAKVWQAIMPRPVRTGLGNFSNNLGYPTTILNEYLQGKGRDGTADIARLVVNTVFGLGFFDPASHIGLPRHNEDFGQTLGKWGVHTGPYLMLPILGPSTVRDTPSRVVDAYTSGGQYLNDQYLRWSLAAASTLEIRAELLATDGMLESSFDPYALTRNAWLKRREYEVRDGNVEWDDATAPDSTVSDDSPALEEPPDAPAGAADAPAAAPADAPPPADPAASPAPSPAPAPADEATPAANPAR